MQGINRTIQPKTRLDYCGVQISPEKQILSNGIPVYLLEGGSQELVKIELVFKAGRWFESKNLVANFTGRMIKEGTHNELAEVIAESIDYYGAYLESSSDKDTATVTLYSLNKYLGQTLPLLADVVLNPSFPEKELMLLKQNRRQHFIINNKKVKYLAKRRFNEQIFGESHPYGKLFHEEDFENIQRDDLINFHANHYVAENAMIIVSGKIPGQLPQLLEAFFSNIKKEGKQKTGNTNVDGETKRERKIIKKSDAVQSAIRIGRVLFNKKHPDYIKMKVLNTVFGGYFGSRLMTNIREDKGYTYGIGSAVVSLYNSGYFFITSELGTDVTQKAIDEIYHEIHILQQELIPEDELELVRNYILGNMMRSLDGAFALGGAFRNLVEYDLDFSYLDTYAKTVKNITADELRELANRYLQKENLCELIVGNI